MNYICITFGPTLADPNYWWNDKERFSTQRAAERYVIEKMPIAGTFGYVVIEETEDSWKVVDELGAPEHAVSIHQDAHGDFHVQPAPQLMMV